MPLNEADIRLVGLLLSPEYVKGAAKEYGNGDLVLGAPLAFAEVRSQCRQYLSYVRVRDHITTRDLKPALALRAAGLAGKLHRIVPLDEDRSVEFQMFSGPADIPAFIQKDIADPWTVIPILSQMFKDLPHLNRAVLDGRCWKRLSPELMLNIRTEEFTQSVVFDASELSVRDVKRHVVKARRRFKDCMDNELFGPGRQILGSWLESGFITSSASCMVSIYNAPAIGWSKLVNNGIPATFTISPKGIGTGLDHRAYEGEHSAEIVNYLMKELL